MSVVHPVVCSPVLNPVVDVQDLVGWRSGKSFPKALALLWPVRPSLVGARKSAVGPDPEWSYVGDQYDSEGNSVGTVPAWHDGKGLWCGPGYTNLLLGLDFPSIIHSNVTVIDELNYKQFSKPDETGTAGCYQTFSAPNSIVTAIMTLRRGDTGNVNFHDFGIFDGTSFVEVVLSIISGPGEVTGYNSNIGRLFGLTTTEDTVIKMTSAVPITTTCYLYAYPATTWTLGAGSLRVKKNSTILTATSVPMPYVPPGTTVASAAGTSGGNGMAFSFDPVEYVTDGVELVTNGGFDSDMTGWELNTGTQEVIDGALVVTRASDTTYTRQKIAGVSVGDRVRVSFDVANIDAFNASIKIGTSVVGGEYHNTGYTDIVLSRKTVDVSLTSVDLFFTIQIGGITAGSKIKVDNISIQRLVPRINTEKQKIIECLRGKTDGVELNPDVPCNDPAVWNAEGASTAGDGAIRIYSPSGALSAVTLRSSVTTLINGGRYLVAYDVVANSSGGISSASGAFTWPSSVGRHVVEYTTDSTTLSFKRVGVTDITLDNVSIQKLLPAKCTVAALVTMGVGSGDLPVFVNPYNILSHTNTTTGVLHWRVETTTPTFSCSRSYDGTNVSVVSVSSWDRGERHIKAVQVNTAGTSFRVGYKRVGVSSEFTWSDWTAFDRSFNPLTYLRLAYDNHHIPLHIAGIQVWDEPEVDEATIERYFKQAGVL